MAILDPIGWETEFTDVVVAEDVQYIYINSAATVKSYIDGNTMCMDFLRAAGEFNEGDKVEMVLVPGSENPLSGTMVQRLLLLNFIGCRPRFQQRVWNSAH